MGNNWYNYVGKKVLFMKKNYLSANKSISVVLCVLMLIASFMPYTVADSTWIDETKLYDDRLITSESMYRLVGGVIERGVVFNNESSSNQIKGYVLEVDINDPDTLVKATYADGDTDEYVRTTVRDQAHAFESKSGYNVVAAINGGRYNTENGAPVGALVMGGVLEKETEGIPFFAILKDGTPVIRPAYSDLSDVAEAVSGMEILVVNGAFTGVDDGILAPRTAVGIRADGSLVFFMADGRQQPESCGMSYPELAQTMIALGSVNAMALDGGGSTTVLTERESNDDIELRNKPSYTVERTVGTSLMICTTAEPTGEFDHVAFSVDKIFCAPNTPFSFDVFGADKYGYKTDMPEGGYLELEDASLGRISGNTFMPGSKTGKTKLNYVMNGEVVASIDVEVSKEADDLITSLFKKIYQTFANFINFIKTVFEKIQMNGLGNLGRI